MNQEHNIRSAQVIRFKRWSNKSFAVFSSLGKVIQIGFLAKIIHGLNSASADSDSNDGELQIDQSEETTEEDWLELKVQKHLELLGLVPSVEMISEDNSIAGKLSAKKFQKHINIYLRPFWGLLFCMCLRSASSSGLSYFKSQLK